MTQSPGRHFLAWAALACAALATGSVAFVKHKDEDNRFCISCHLHEDLYSKTTSAVPGTLAAAHYQAKAPGHPERCFTCHSGEGAWGWTQVTALSAWDAARWVAGGRHEPDSMRLKLENPACLKCHAADLQAAASGRASRGLASADFHKLSEHRGIAASCVTCHTAHTAGAPAKDYMNDSRVHRECARCHPRGLGTESDF